MSPPESLCFSKNFVLTPHRVASSRWSTSFWLGSSAGLVFVVDVGNISYTAFLPAQPGLSLYKCKKMADFCGFALRCSQDLWLIQT